LEELVKVMERKSYNELEIYTEISLMSKELRDSILQMKRYYRFDVGDENYKKINLKTLIM
jgi:hypothetical protein